MRYTDADFIRLMTEIEGQGGMHLNELCGGEEHTFIMPDGKERTHFARGCENESMFHVDYDPYSTVMVPEPVLEPNPERGNQSHRAKMERDPSDPTGKRKRPIVQIVERSGHYPAGGPSPVRVCANDDNVGMWPRFKHVIKDAKSR